MKRLPLSLIALVILVIQVDAQKEATVWYFGVHAGINFSGNMPVAITDGALDTEEGTASICDSAGNLLFYTDGVSVFNKTHERMPGGTHLWGSYTTTQTLIVPQPGCSPIYYIFTASPQYDVIFGTDTDSVGLHYTKVDMRLNNGLGDITEKNILLFRNTTEKITGVLHANGKDVWVVAHEWGNNKFRSYLVIEDGILPQPVVSTVGEAHEGDGVTMRSKGNALGQMKLSPDATKLGLAIWEKGVFLYDFDSQLGTVANQVTIKRNPKVSFYGLEFSSDSKHIYFTDVFIRGCETELEKSILYQFVIPEGTTSEVGAFVGLLGGLQLSIDGSIYATQCNDLTNRSSAMGVIRYPNRSGTACDFQESGLDLITGRGLLSVPNFVQSYFVFKDPVILFPNVFTPGPDNFNPKFAPIKYENVLDATLLIVNRWGQEIYKTSDISTGWDGANATSGVYYWILRYEGKSGRTGSLNGVVELIY